MYFEILSLFSFTFVLYDCKIENFPPTINSYPECHKVVTRAAAKIVGEGRSSLPQKTMVAEDFSYFLHARPGTVRVTAHCRLCEYCIDIVTVLIVFIHTHAAN